VTIVKVVTLPVEAIKSPTAMRTNAGMRTGRFGYRDRHLTALIAQSHNPPQGVGHRRDHVRRWVRPVNRLRRAKRESGPAARFCTHKVEHRRSGGIELA